MEEQLIPESRTHNASNFAIETRADGKKVLSGYGIVFNKLTRDMGGWKERIHPSAAEQADFSEVISKYNHDINHVLGTTWARTLTYEVDSIGVKYSVELPDTTTGRDIEVLVNRGDLRDSSFEFTVAKDGVRWDRETINGIDTEIRNVTRFSKIYDLSPVMVGAYPTTGEIGLKVAKREFDELVTAREQQEQDAAVEDTLTPEEPEAFELSAADEILLNNW